MTDLRKKTLPCLELTVFISLLHFQARFVLFLDKRFSFSSQNTSDAIRAAFKTERLCFKKGVTCCNCTCFIVQDNQHTRVTDIEQYLSWQIAVLSPEMPVHCKDYFIAFLFR